MKILLWHGYLLGGTGSNVYTRELARIWSGQGHDVTVFCQEPNSQEFDLGSARVVRPQIGPILPVFVLDRYADVESRLVQDCSAAERNRFVEANAEALKAHLPADVVFTNHVLLGAPVGAAAGTPFVVKAHGSELEFSIRGNGELAGWARETLSKAKAVLAGSKHIENVIADVVGEGDFSQRIHIVPPGVNVQQFRPEERAEARRNLLAAANQDPPNPPGKQWDERLPDGGLEAKLDAFLAWEDETPLIVYFGKLSHEKGVHLLVKAVDGMNVRVVIAGFGEARRDLERQAGQIGTARFLFTGPLQHRHLAPLLALADISVAPSIFPEAFGMVAAEAAAAGAIPLVARHSGLREIAEGVQSEFPDEAKGLAGFERDDAEDLRLKIRRILEMSASQRQTLSTAARRAVEKHWSWETVARKILEISTG